jgi:hypothetical protein
MGFCWAVLALEDTPGQADEDLSRIGLEAMNL